MIRIFSTLATVTGMALAASLLTGVLSQWRGSAANPHDPTYLVHFFIGLFAAIVTLLLHCIIFTYFLGTGRWVKEVKIAYRLADEPIPRLTRDLKRQTFPPALAAMLVTIAAAASGAGTQLRLAEWPWQVHATLGVMSLVVNLWAFRVEFRNVQRNSRAIVEIHEEVERIRAEQGLPPSAQAMEDLDNTG
jgi:hypothetical protein